VPRADFTVSDEISHSRRGCEDVSQAQSVFHEKKLTDRRFLCEVPGAAGTA
jgi:hypothetical protein